MLIFTVIFVLAVTSILLAVRSLKQLKKLEKVTEVKDELKKGKVLFQSDSSPSSSESSSLS